MAGRPPPPTSVGQVIPSHPRSPSSRANSVSWPISHESSGTYPAGARRAAAFSPTAQASAASCSSSGVRSKSTSQGPYRLIPADAKTSVSPVEHMPEDWHRAVAVVAHPDDLEYGAASAIARWTRQGKEVVYVLATSGEAGIDGMDPAEARPLREDEERRSAAVVGVSAVEFLGHPDGLIEPGLPLRRDIAAALRRHQPDVVVTMNFELTWGEGGGVNHADHRAVGVATLDACRDAANRWLWPELGAPWSGITDVYVAAAATPTHY